MGNNALFFSFYTGFYPENCKDGYDSISWASEKAYLDMNRTMTFREEGKNAEKNRKAWRDDGTGIIREGISSINASNFDDLHKKICDSLIGIYGNENLVEREKGKRTENPTKLTYGQAQKWLNMTLKYLWTLARLGVLEGDIAGKMIACEKKLHVPLDSYILRYADCQERKRTAPQNGLSSRINSIGEWSKINNYDSYREYQIDLKDKIKDGISPIEWELEHWHKAVEFYG